MTPTHPELETIIDPINEVIGIANLHLGGYYSESDAKLALDVLEINHGLPTNVGFVFDVESQSQFIDFLKVATYIKLLRADTYIGDEELDKALVAIEPDLKGYSREIVFPGQYRSYLQFRKMMQDHGQPIPKIHIEVIDNPKKSTGNPYQGIKSLAYTATCENLVHTNFGITAKTQKAYALRYWSPRYNSGKNTPPFSTTHISIAQDKTSTNINRDVAVWAVNQEIIKRQVNVPELYDMSDTQVPLKLEIINSDISLKVYDLVDAAIRRLVRKDIGSKAWSYELGFDLSDKKWLGLILPKYPREYKSSADRLKFDDYSLLIFSDENDDSITVQIEYNVSRPQPGTNDPVLFRTKRTFRIHKEIDTEFGISMVKIENITDPATSNRERKSLLLHFGISTSFATVAKGKGMLDAFEGGRADGNSNN